MAKRLVLLVAAAVVLACIAVAIALFVLPHGDRPIKADAVFVLSGSRRRLPVGVKLVRDGYAPLLVVSRSSPNVPPLERQACAHRLDVRVLCVRAKPYSTQGEAELLARLAASRGWNAVDVVTSRYHVVRARILIRRCYHGTLRVVGAPVGFLELVHNAVLESVKLAYHELVHRRC
jgi:uncharacterized SAM-binding protein YcdF (DUF218 family)